MLKVKVSQSFTLKPNRQIAYMANDKPEAARKLKSQIIQALKQLPKIPFKNHQSIFFENPEIRDLVVKGYIIVYEIEQANNTIHVFGFTKWKDRPY